MIRPGKRPFVGPARARLRPLAPAAVLVTALALQGVLAAPAAAQGPSTEAARGGRSLPAAPAKTDPGLGQPSIQYQEALAHAHDVRVFEPGDRVTVPFRPRAGDTWAVGGAAPRVLPAGRASGRELAASPTGSVWADVPGVAIPAGAGQPPGAPVDAPANAPVVAAAGTTFVAPSPATLPTTDVLSGLRRQVIGFLPYWNLGSPSTVLNYDMLSTVAYFAVGVDSGGNLIKSGTLWSGWTSAAMTSVINAAHTKGTRVALTVELFAWSSSEAATQTAVLGSASARLNLATQIAAAVRDRGADGVNIDFEPIASGYSSQFVAFLQTLRAQLNAINPGYQVTVDTTGYVGNYDLPGIVGTGGADAVFIMGYDYRSAGSNPVGSIDPLYSPTVYDLTDTLNAYLARIPASKVILGLPWYGRAWSTTSNGPNGTNQSGSYYGYSATPTYAVAVELGAANGRRYDSVEQSPWTAYQGVYGSCGCTTWRELYYDDAQSLAARYDLINRRGLAGTGIWALGNDGYVDDANVVHLHADLWQPIANAFLTDTTPPQAGIVDLPDTQTDEGFPVSWTGWDWSGVRSYDVQVSTDGGAWTGWLSGTTATSATFLGQTGHAYAFRVRGTDGAGNVGAWNVTTLPVASPSLAVGGFSRVVVSQVNLRSTPSSVDSSNIYGQATQGTTLAITGGPVSANGVTWWQVTEPITEWAPVNPVNAALWVAAGDSSGAFISPVQAPNASRVSAGISGLGFGGLGAASLGAAGAASRTFTPGSGSDPTLEVDWTDNVSLGSVSLNVLTTGGTTLGTIGLGARGSGAQRFDWDGSVGGVALGSGTYVLQVVGTAGSTTYHAPSASPATPDQVALYGVTIDRAAGATFVPLAPARLLDTRNGTDLSGRFSSGVARTFAVWGRAGVPAGAVAVTGNLTVVNQSAAGYVALTTSPTNSPSTSTLNFPLGDIRANGATVALDGAGNLSATYMSGRTGDSTDVVFDVTGYFVAGSAGTTYVSLAPGRVLDTRYGTDLSGPFSSGIARTFAVWGHSGVPSGALAVTGNLTVTGASRGGYVALTTDPTNSPSTSTLNFPFGDDRANGVTVRLDGSGNLSATYISGRSGDTTSLVFDVTGYFVAGSAGAVFVPLAPGRVLDTRYGTDLSGPFSSGVARTFGVWGRAGVPADARAITANLTVTGSTWGGYLALTTNPTNTPSTSTLNFPRGDTRANGAVAGLDAAGNLSATYVSGRGGDTTSVILDVTGYFR
ncbi:MAG TPA: glycosyl hydrolase family 18 protein [Candidatus Limnocylindrales bacterium]